MEKQKCPVVRFSKFGENWEAQPLKNIFGKIRNAFVGTATPYYVKKGNFYLESNNVKDGLINRKTQIFIDDYFYFKQKDKWLKTGDLIMVQSGHVGHAAVIPEELNNSAAHALIMFSDYKVPTNPHFLNYQLQTNNAKSAIEKFTTGNTIRHILSSDMKEFLGFFTNFDEQLKVGEFFQNLDQSIALHEKKLAQTQNFKKAMLEKMFPKQGSKQPEIRLKGFSGDWEEIELEDIFGKIRNAFVGTATPYYVKSGHFYLESNNVKDGKINRKTEIFINDYFYFKQQDKWLKTNDIVMVQSGHVGHTAVIPEELNNSAAHALIMFTDYKIASDSYFINYQFQTNRSKVAVDKITTGNTIKHILSSDMKKFILLFPCANEQKKIGEFFKQVDKTLNLQQQQLQTLKNLKQALLEKMFV